MTSRRAQRLCHPPRPFLLGSYDKEVEEYHKYLRGGPPPPHPEVNEGDAGRPKLLCVGDGVTAGAPLAPGWVEAIAVRNPSLEVVNAGTPWDFAWQLRQKKEKLLKENPALVCVMIGTNDAIGICSPERCVDEVFVKEGALPPNWRQAKDRRPSVESYEKHLREVLRIFVQWGCRVVVVTPPPLGEDFAMAPLRCNKWGPLCCPPNEAVSNIASAAKRAAVAEGCDTLPLLQCLRARLEHRGSLAGVPWLPADHFCSRVVRMPRTVAEGPGKVLWEDLWPDRERGFFCHDLVHLNERGAALLCGLLQTWIDSNFPAIAPADP